MLVEIVAVAALIIFYVVGLAIDKTLRKLWPNTLDSSSSLRKQLVKLFCVATLLLSFALTLFLVTDGPSHLSQGPVDIQADVFFFGGSLLFWSLFGVGSCCLNKGRTSLFI